MNFLTQRSQSQKIKNPNSDKVKENLKKVQEDIDENFLKSFEAVDAVFIELNENIKKMVS